MTPRTAPSAFFLRLFILSLPFQTGTLLYAQDWGRGFHNPYLSIFLYGWEGLLFLAAGFFLWETLNGSRHKALRLTPPLKVAVTFLAAVFLSFLWAPESNLLFTLLVSAKVGESILLALLFQDAELGRREFFQLFALGMAGQAVLAIAQLAMGHSLGLSFLGEPQLSSTMANVAHFQWKEITLLRGYGTFAHPNILGAFLDIGLLGAILHPQKSKTVQRVLLTILVLGLLVSFSRTAFLGVAAASLALPLKKAHRYGLAAAFLALLMGVFLMKGGLWQDISFQERWTGVQQAVALIREHPLGVGWRQGTLLLDTVAETPLMPWDYQPVHNVFLLVLLELGPLGLILCCGFFIHVCQKLARKKSALLVFPIVFFCTSFFDHYWVSSDAALTLLWLVVLVTTATLDHSSQPNHE